MALRYVNEGVQLYTFILGCFPYNAASHSAQNSREFVYKVLEEFKLQLDGEILMLDIFKKVFFELRERLINTKTTNDYNLIDKQVLDDICGFLEPLQEVLDALSEDQQPSLYRVLPLRKALINLCEAKEIDSDAIIQLKIFLGEKIIILNISQPHLIHIVYQLFSIRR